MHASKHRVRFVSGIAISAAVYIAAHLGFAGSSRVWIIDACALFLGFGLPSLLVSSPQQWCSRGVIWFPLVVTGLFSWDALMSVFVPKHDFFWMGWAYYPLGLSVLAALLFVHSLIVGLVFRSTTLQDAHELG